MGRPAKAPEMPANGEGGAPRPKPLGGRLLAGKADDGRGLLFNQTPPFPGGGAVTPADAGLALIAAVMWEPPLARASTC